ncbi:putative RNA methyltransferase [Marinobacter sp.]|uniref:putative RNA methyltransferase n=1 Tax=Marinobacter sp. TaxID=50741 RepID=UPI0035645B36
MTVVPFEALACPLDAIPLVREGRLWRCATGHSFDIARQGYVHLLPVQNKRSRDPGDSKLMVTARQRFLEAGFYQPIADAVIQTALDGVASGATVSCLDAGCGEGYYLRQLASAAGEHTLSLLGLDISKWAVLAAARQDDRPNWVVGSNANLPVLPASLDRILCLFGFPVYPEFARVLKPGGKLIQVDAGQDHLRELREIIYPEVRAESKKVAEAPEGFRRIRTEDVRFSLHLAGSEPITDLLAMTPHLYRASHEGRERASVLESLSLTVDVCLHTFERNGTDDRA